MSIFPFTSAGLVLVNRRRQVEEAKRARIEAIERAVLIGMTQREIARFAGVSLRTVSEIAKSVRSEQAAS